MADDLFAAAADANHLTAANGMDGDGGEIDGQRSRPSSSTSRRGLLPPLVFTMLAALEVHEPRVAAPRSSSRSEEVQPYFDQDQQQSHHNSSLGYNTSGSYDAEAAEADSSGSGANYFFRDDGYGRDSSYLFASTDGAFAAPAHPLEGSLGPTHPYEDDAASIDDPPSELLSPKSARSQSSGGIRVVPMYSGGRDTRGGEDPFASSRDFSESVEDIYDDEVVGSKFQ